MDKVRIVKTRKNVRAFGHLTQFNDSFRYTLDLNCFSFDQSGAVLGICFLT